MITIIAFVLISIIPLVDVEAQQDYETSNNALSTAFASPPPTVAPSPPTISPPPTVAPSPPTISPPPAVAPSAPTIKPRLSRTLPDEGCYFNPDLLKCKPDEEGTCPPGFGFSEAERCIPTDCPDGFKHLDEDESGICYPLVIDLVIEKIDKKIKSMPSESNCNTVIHKSVDLPEDKLQKDDPVIIAVFDRGGANACHIIGGEVLINIRQQDENHVKLVGIGMGGPQMVVLNTEKMQPNDQGQILKANFSENMLGVTPTGDEIPIDNIYALLLWNNSTVPVNLDKPVLLNVSISKQEEFGDSEDSEGPFKGLPPPQQASNSTITVENATGEITAPIENFDNQTQFMTNDDMDVHSTLLSYSNTQLGISLKHPTDWKEAYLKDGIQFIKEKDRVYVEIRKDNLGSPQMELKKYVDDDIKDRSSSREDFKLLNMANTTISGNLPAYKAIYTFLKTENQKDFATEGMTSKILRTWTIADGNAYLVAYVADKDNYGLYLPIAEKIINSLKINLQSQ